MPTIKVEYCGFYQYSWPSHFIIRVFTTYTTTSGVYIMLYTECMVSKRRKVDQSTIFVSFLNFWTYFMSELAYKTRHVFKNIFKLPIPSYTSYSFLKHLNTILTIRAILTMAYLYHQSFIIRTKLQFINFFLFHLQIYVICIC